TSLQLDKPVDRSDGKTLFDQYYRPEYDLTQEADLELQSGFADRGMKYDHVDLWDTLPRGGPPSRFPAYANEFDTANGVIIAQANFKQFDSQKKLEWSELMYQTWPHAQMKADELHRRDVANKKDPPHPAGGPIANLRAIVQHSALPRGTRAVITAAYNANKNKGYSIGRGDETWRKWTEVETRDFFYALVGTDSVKSTIWLLKDHAAELRKKTIVAIWTKWPGLSPDLWYVCFFFVLLCSLASGLFSVRRSRISLSWLQNQPFDSPAFGLCPRVTADRRCFLPYYPSYPSTSLTDSLLSTF
ncbi:MAG: hypothetical protein Q9193_007248, partial [Seirophora villosa]